MSNYMYEYARGYIKKHNLYFMEYGEISNRGLISQLARDLQCRGCGSLKEGLGKCKYCGGGE